MKNVQDMYPLTPMQEAMLLHAVSRHGDDVLLNQFRYELHGDLDSDAFGAAWQRLVDRHAVLRTGFVWDKLKRPLQVVRHKATLAFEVLDWRATAAAEQREGLDRLCAADRQRGFDLTRAPLMRLTLVRLDDTAWHLLWTSHHLVIDRWCLTTLFDELAALYGPGDSALNAAPGFRDYVAWIAAQDGGAARRYWRGVLSGVVEPGRVCVPADRTVSPARAHLAMDATQTAALREFARVNAVTPSILLQAAWGLTVNRITGAVDVLLGVAVSGRPPGLAEVEHIVGSFVNNLPQRITMAGDLTVGEWLSRLQSAQHRRLPFEHVSAASLKQWAGLAAGAPLFDTLAVWLSPDAPIRLPGVRIEGLPGTLATAYPLTLSFAETATDLELQARTAAGVRTREPLQRLLETLAETACSLVAHGAQNTLATLPGLRDEGGARSPARHLNRVAEDDGIALIPSAGDVAAQAQSGREAIDPVLIRDLVQSEWRQVLGRNDVGPDDDFFDAGGTSLLAASLHAGIEASTRKSVPLLALFQHPTVNRMVETLQREDWPLKADMVTPVRTSGAAPPLFCIASPEVNTVGYAMLARHLDGRHPVYVIQAPPDTADLRKLAPAELPAVARRYVDALLGAHPRGPVRLLGMCTGAHLTVEMARQLELAGRNPGFVGIVNTWALYTVSRLYHLQRVLNRISYYGRRLADLRHMEAGQILDTVRRIGARRARTAGRAVAPGRSRTDGQTPTPRPVPWIDEVGWAHKDPGRAKYSGRVSVFRIRRQPFWRTRDRALGWGRASRAVDVETLPGNDHDAILRPPHVEALARRIEACLAGDAQDPRTDGAVAEPQVTGQLGA